MSHMDDGEFMGTHPPHRRGHERRAIDERFAYGLDKYPEDAPSWRPIRADFERGVGTDFAADFRSRTCGRTAMKTPKSKADRQGDKLSALVSVANRDETCSTMASTSWSIARMVRHLSFGYGIHRCVGARVAELQLTILLEEMANGGCA